MTYTFIDIVHPSTSGTGSILPKAFPMWAARGWELANAEDEALLTPPVPPPGVDVITRPELDVVVAELEAEVAATYAARPAGIADGQLLQWDATTQRFNAVNPTGLAEVAYAENVTAATTAWSGTGGLGGSVNIPQCTITVPASTRPVYITFGCTIRMTTLGVGAFVLGLYETTGGANVNKCFDIRSLPQSVTAGPADVSLDKTWRLGPTVAERTFKLVGFCWTNAGDDAAGVIINNPANPSYVAAAAR